MTTDILAEIDDVLGQQPDLFEHLVDDLFPEGVSVQQGGEESLRSALRFHRDCGVEEWADEWHHGQIIPMESLRTWSELDCRAPKIEIGLSAPRLHQEEVNAYLVGLWRAPLPKWADRELVAAHQMGRELADLIAWQP